MVFVNGINKRELVIDLMMREIMIGNLLYIAIYFPCSGKILGKPFKAISDQMQPKMWRKNQQKIKTKEANN